MEKHNILPILKSLRIVNDSGAIFQTQQDCLNWTNKVLPLLKYDQTHYEDFRYNAQFMEYEVLSNSRRMKHINAMLGIVQQAVIELENNIEGDKTPKDTTEAPKEKHNISKPPWYQRPIGMIGIGVTN